MQDFDARIEAALALFRDTIERLKEVQGVSETSARDAFARRDLALDRSVANPSCQLTGGAMSSRAFRTLQASARSSKARPSRDVIAHVWFALPLRCLRARAMPPLEGQGGEGMRGRAHTKPILRRLFRGLGEIGFVLQNVLPLYIIN